MTNQTNQIPLSPASINQLTELCKRIEQKNPKNEISLNMAKGIADHIKKYGWVSQAQAQWLCRNADYWKIQRVPELAGIQVPIRGSACSSANNSASETGKAIGSDLKAEIEKLLDIIERLREASARVDSCLTT